MESDSTTELALISQRCLLHCGADVCVHGSGGSGLKIKKICVLLLSC